MKAFYRHSQIGHLLRWSTIPAAIGLSVAGYIGGKGLLLLPLAAILAGVGWVFSCLTVEISSEELIWFFGSGMWLNRIPRDEIVSATPARNKWWWGWGIHLTPRGWLYNVAGLEAVEIALRDGTTIRIGSDEHTTLADALRGDRS